MTLLEIQSMAARSRLETVQLTLRDFWIKFFPNFGYSILTGTVLAFAFKFRFNFWIALSTGCATGYTCHKFNHRLHLIDLAYQDDLILRMNEMQH